MLVNPYGAFAADSENVLKIGFISPRTGPLGSFGQTDGYVLDLASKAVANGIKIGDKTYKVELIDKDTQSDPSRASQLAKGLISGDPTYPVWRTGADSATALHTDADLTIGEVKVPKGDYSLYVAIGNPDAWVLIVNKQTGQWGLTYDSAQNLGQVKMTMSKPKAMVENLTYALKDLGGGKGKLILCWENHVATVPVTAR